MSIPAVIFAGLAAIFAVFTVWLAIEAVLLASHQQPITWYIRNNVSWHHVSWVITGILLFGGVIMAVTHFILDAGS